MVSRGIKWTLKLTMWKCCRKSSNKAGCSRCDRKARAASAQSFTLWQQAIMEITRRDHSLLLVRAAYIWVLFVARIPFVVNRTFNATLTERLQQHPLLFTMNHTARTFFSWRLHLARPSHSGHSTIILRSESPKGKCAQLHTKLRATYMWVLFFAHIPFPVNRTFSATLTERLQHNQVSRRNVYASI